MKQKISQLKRHPSYDKVMHWGKLISITGSTQIIIQAIGFVCGIIIIRLLPVQEYAFYTLANTMLGTMSVLADGGISGGVMAQGGKVWQNKEKLGVVLATGLDLRRKFAIGSLLVSVPILFYLLVYNNASWLTAVLITASLIPAFYAALSDSLLEIVPKLHQSILPLQKNQLSVSLGRLVLSGLGMFIFPWAFMAVLAAGLPRIWGNFQLRKIVYGLVDRNQEPDRSVQIEVLSIVKRQMPESIYYCLSGQINIWLISIFGTTAALASLGALGRFSIITGLLLVVFTTLIVPRFARSSNEREQLRNKILYLILLLFIVSVAIITIAFIFSKQFLWILGKNYYSLNREFMLIIIGSCITLIQGVFFSINYARGWIISPLLYILISITTTVLALFLFDVSTLEGVILFNVGISTAQALVLVIYCFYKISKL
jgi:O-antigen/teichoic acid export membrane protein